MGAGVEALGRTLAANDVAPRAHAAGDDAELAGAGADRALARKPYFLAEVLLALDVVVMAIDRFTGHLEAGEVAPHRFQHELHHLLAIGARVVLRPADRFNIVAEVRCAFRKVRQIPVRQLDVVPFRILPRQLYEVGADGVADAATARMQHDPDSVPFIQADLDEVIAAAERAELVHPARALTFALFDAGMLFQDPAQALLEAPRRMVAHVAVLVLAEAHRDIAADLVEHL